MKMATLNQLRQQTECCLDISGQETECCRSLRGCFIYDDGGVGFNNWKKENRVKMRRMDQHVKEREGIKPNFCFYMAATQKKKKKTKPKSYNKLPNLFDQKNVNPNSLKPIILLFPKNNPMKKDRAYFANHVDARKFEKNKII